MRIQVSARRKSDERGAVMIVAPALVIVLVGVVAFVTDFGMAYANKRNLQNGVDAAVLAVGNEMALTAAPTANCAAMKTQAETTASRSIAQNYFSLNAPAVGAELVPGAEGYAATCNASGQLIITAKARQSSPSFFGGIFGISDVPIDQQARAIVGPAGTIVGLRPFAICQAMADLVLKDLNALHTFDFDNAGTGCGYAPGNWAVLDFNGGSNSTAELATWVRPGFDGPVSNATPLIIEGNPGAPNPGALKQEMDLMLGEDIVLPVFDQFTPGASGANAKLRIIKFISVKSCAWQFNGQSGIDPCGAVPVPAPSNYLQVKFSHFIPIGELNLTCPLADAGACDSGIRLSKLAD